MSKTFFCTVALSAAFAVTMVARADDYTWTTNVNGVLEIWVDDGKEVTLNTAGVHNLGSALNGVVKTGGGQVILTLTGQISGKTIEIREGSIYMKGDYVFGSVHGGNTIKVSDGAALWMNYNVAVSGNQFAGKGAYFNLELEGDGVDGLGALRDWCNGAADLGKGDVDAFFGDVKLTGDTTVFIGYRRHHGFGGLLDLNGKTLKLQYSNKDNDMHCCFIGGAYRRGQSDSQRCRVTPGNIIVDNMYLVFEYDPIFDGDFSGSTITISNSLYASEHGGIWLRDLTTPLPFEIVNRTTNSYLVAAGTSFRPSMNEIAGPLVLGANLYCRGDDPRQSILISGPISEEGGNFSIYNQDANSAKHTVYFGNANNDFFGICCYGGRMRALVDGAFPRASIGLACDSRNAFAELPIDPGGVSEAYAVSCIARANSWKGLDASARIALRMETDRTFTADITSISNNTALTHTGPGDLTFTGSLPATTAFENVETNKTIFAGSSDRTITNFRIYDGLVELPQGGPGLQISNGMITNGTLLLRGGTFSVVNGGRFWISRDEGSWGSVVQTGGAFSVLGTDNNWGLALSSGGTGEYLMRGGTFSTASSFIYLGSTSKKSIPQSAPATAVMTIMGDAAVDVNAVFYLNQCTNGFMSVLNLNGGRFSSQTIQCSSMNARTNGFGYVNFNGGTFRSNTKGNDQGSNGKAPIFGSCGGSPTAVTVFGGGAIFDLPEGYTNAFSSLGNSCQAEFMLLRSASGRGVASITLPSGMPRTGYKLGVRPVTVSGGGGTCCTASLDWNPDDGTVGDALIVTCPGWDYTTPPTVTAYGSDGLAYECTATLTEGDQDPGTFVKTGGGQLNINTPSNTFFGTYIVSNGVLRIPRWASLSPDCSVRMAGGMFDGNWISRTVKSFGGWGRYQLYPGNSSTCSFTVTDSLVFDAADIAKGRFLEMTPDPDERDRLSLTANVKVVIENPEQLASLAGFKPLITSSVAINRMPTLEGLPPDRFILKFRDGGKTLGLKCVKGAVFVVR